MAAKRSQVVSGRGYLFTPVPFALIEDPNLTTTEKMVYVTLSRFTDLGKDGGAYPGHAALSQMAGCSASTLKLALTALRGAGWVEWESGAERGATNRYIVHRERGVADKRLGGVAHSELPGSRPPATQVADNRLQQRTSLTEIPVPNPPAGGSNGNGNGKTPHYVAQAIDEWNATFGMGTAAPGVIAGNLGALVKAGNPPELVSAAFSRFVKSEDANFGVAYFRQRFANYTSETNPVVEAKVSAEADLSKARSCGPTVIAYRDAHGGDAGEWWQRMKKESKARNRHVLAYAFEQIQAAVTR